MLWMYTPKSRSYRSTTDCATGAPPLKLLLIAARASLPGSARSASAMNAVIAPTVNVGRYLSMRSRTVTGSNR